MYILYIHIYIYAHVDVYMYVQKTIRESDRYAQECTSIFDWKSGIHTHTDIYVYIYIL